MNNSVVNDQLRKFADRVVTFHTVSRTNHEVATRGGTHTSVATPTAAPPTLAIGGSQDRDSIYQEHTLHEEDSIPDSPPVVYTWGGCTSLPIRLDPPIKETNEPVVGVACGRDSRAGVTKDGKLFFWKVSTKPEMLNTTDVGFPFNQRSN